MSLIREYRAGPELGPIGRDGKRCRDWHDKVTINLAHVVSASPYGEKRDAWATVISLSSRASFIIDAPYDEFVRSWEAALTR